MRESTEGEGKTQEGVFPTFARLSQRAMRADDFFLSQLLLCVVAMLGCSVHRLGGREVVSQLGEKSRWKGVSSVLRGLPPSLPPYLRFETVEREDGSSRPQGIVKIGKLRQPNTQSLRELYTRPA